MVYNLTVYIDGVCRGNGRPHSRGAAAAWFPRWLSGSQACYVNDKNYTATNQRAAMTAFILAMELVLRKREELQSKPYMKIYVLTNNTYVNTCLDDNLEKWMRNGWTTANRKSVANQDLIMRAAKLRQQVEDFGDVQIDWIEKDLNVAANEMANDYLDELVGHFNFPIFNVNGS